MHLTFNYWQVGLVVAVIMLPLTIGDRTHRSLNELILFNIIIFILRVLFWPIQIIECMLALTRIEMEITKHDEEE